MTELLIWQGFRPYAFLQPNPVRLSWLLFRNHVYLPVSLRHSFRYFLFFDFYCSFCHDDLKGYRDFKQYSEEIVFVLLSHLRLFRCCCNYSWYLLLFLVLWHSFSKPQTNCSPCFRNSLASFLHLLPTICLAMLYTSVSAVFISLLI